MSSFELNRMEKDRLDDENLRPVIAELMLRLSITIHINIKEAQWEEIIASGLIERINDESLRYINSCPRKAVKDIKELKPFDYIFFSGKLWIIDEISHERNVAIMSSVPEYSSTWFTLEQDTQVERVIFEAGIAESHRVSGKVSQDFDSAGSVSSEATRVESPQFVETQYSIPNTQYKNDERALAEQLIGIITLAQAKEKNRPIIVALGTSWLDDYDVRGLTHDALNGLIISLRNFCESKGIAFLDRKDDALLGAIHEAKIGKENARVVVLAGQKTLPGADRDSLLDDPNTFLAAVDTRNMASREYIRLVEMLGMAINLAFDRVIAYDSKNIDVDPKSKNFCIFIPHALPVDYKAIDPKTFYKVQTNA